jgi:hypothetical protein
MPMTIRVRALGEEEAAELARMVRSRTLGAGRKRSFCTVPIGA